MLGALLDRHRSHVWLVNTGWSGGAYGTGSRMKLSYTRAMVGAALAGALDDAVVKVDPVFGLAVPQAVEGVPRQVLDARGTWQDGAAYDRQAAKLAGMFRENITKFGSAVSRGIMEAGPRAP